MKRVVLGLALCTTACTQPTGGVSASLNGSNDLVLVDQLADDGTVARLELDDATAFKGVGLPGRYLFLTSTATSELRVLELFRPNYAGRDFMRAPNPIETLSIPVLERPTILATDEGRNSVGQRVTGHYVYAARPGGSEVSVVSVGKRRQLGGHPLSVPGTIVAIGASMQVGADDRLPATTVLYVATWDGADSSVFAATLTTDADQLETEILYGKVAFKRVATLPATPVSALFVVSPLSTRTVDGSPFCATEACLAIATRVGSTGAGESWLFAPSTRASIKMAFPAAVRKFATGALTRRLYGLLDESVCGSPACGGVVAVDLLEATSIGGFPRAVNVLGRPFGPIRATDGLIAGLSIAQGASVRQVGEQDDAGTFFLVQRYDELGAFTSSDGLLTWFSGTSGSLIDYDGRRTVIDAASVRLPATLPDGGETFFTEDGGATGSLLSATVTTGFDVTQTNRVSAVTFPGETPITWTVDVSDGYFLSQEIAIVARGLIPGLVNVNATPQAVDGGFAFGASGFEVRAASGDTVILDVTTDGSNFLECGRAPVDVTGNGFIQIAQLPITCGSPSRFSVRAGGSKPLVIAGSVEGYMGRSGAGERFTYNRPYVLVPAEVTADRTSLAIEMPMVGLSGEGAYLTLGLTSHMTPLRVGLDVNATGLTQCSSSLPGQVVFGNLVMAQAPFNSNAQLQAIYPWSAFMNVPSGNAVAEVRLELTRSGSTGLNGTDGALCKR